MFEPDNTGIYEVTYSPKFAQETSMSTKDSFLELIGVDPDFPNKLVEGIMKLSTVLKRTFNYSLTAIKNNPNQKVTKLSSKKHYSSYLNSYQKRKILNESIKKMIWNGQVKLIQRPFWIWKILLGQKCEVKTDFFRRSKKLIMRTILNRVLRFHFFQVKKLFENFKQFALKMKQTKLNDFKQERKSSIKVGPNKVEFGVKKKGIRTTLRVFNFFALKKIAKYLGQWKKHEVFYSQYTEEVNYKELHIRNFQLLQKPRIELVYYDRVSTNPGIAGFLNCFSHLYKNRKRYALNLLSSNLKRDQLIITPTSASYYLHLGKESFNLWRVVKKSRKLQEKNTLKEINHFSTKRAPFLHLYKWHKTELIFMKGQYFTELKKMIYG